MEEKERSFLETPTWAVAVVIAVMVAAGMFFHACLKQLDKWFDKRKRKALVAALEKIEDELMVFGLLSLLLGHWIGYVARICVKSSALSTQFYMCGPTTEKYLHAAASHDLDSTSASHHKKAGGHRHCPEGHEPFASEESLEQLHRFMFVLAVTHAFYSFVTVALALSKISSWREWENHAKSLASEIPRAPSHSRKMTRLATFIGKHASHPWSKRRVLVWLLSFSRQFWSSTNQADYMALRLGFVTTHQLPLTYDFHNYMLRRMEEEFRDIVGISGPLWIYALLSLFLEFHGTRIYFCLSFAPAILAIEVIGATPKESSWFNLRDDLFWFGKPKLLLFLIQFISFQNAFEMSTFLWSMWEINASSCFMDNKTSVIIRLTFGVVSQVWCSYVTFPLYVIVTQMGSTFKRSVVSENVRSSLHQWQKRVRRKRSKTPASSSMHDVEGSTTKFATDHEVSPSSSSSYQSSSTDYDDDDDDDDDDSNNNDDGGSNNQSLHHA